MSYIGVISDLFGVVEDTTFFGLLIVILIFLVANVAQFIWAKMKSDKFADFEEYVDRNVKEKEALNMRAKRLAREKDQVIKQFEEFLAKYNEEKEKAVEKETKFEEKIKNFEEELTKIPAMEDEMKFYRKKIGELNNEKAELQRGFEAEKHKIKEKHEEEIREIRGEMDKLSASHADEKNRVAGEFEVEKTGRMAQHEAEVARLKKELEETEQAHGSRVEEIKTKTKDTISNFIAEKEGIINKLRSENNELTSEIDRLKKEIKVLEVDHL